LVENISWRWKAVKSSCAARALVSGADIARRAGIDRLGFFLSEQSSLSFWTGQLCPLPDS
jgi:hypothetical protein